VAAATAEGDGIFMVGAAVGFGGKLIRTVSFFGCTLADSEGLGGTGTGVFSAIKSSQLLAQTRIHTERCQMHIPRPKGTRNSRRPTAHRPSAQLVPVSLALAALARASIPAAPGSRGAFFTGPGNINGQSAALEFFAMEHFDRLVGLFGRSKLQKRKSSRFPGELIHHHRHGSHDACRGEELLQVTVHSLIREIANEESGLIHFGLWGNGEEQPSGAILHSHESRHFAELEERMIHHTNTITTGRSYRPQVIKPALRVNERLIPMAAVSD
jgi:hypothetical protein